MDVESLTIKPPQSDQQNTPSLEKEDEEFRVIATGDLSNSTDEMWKEIACHLIFNVKLSECFRRKATFLADGHKTSTFKGLDILGCDVQNAILSANNL